MAEESQTKLNYSPSLSDLECSLEKSVCSNSVMLSRPKIILKGFDYNIVSCKTITRNKLTKEVSSSWYAKESFKDVLTRY